MEKNYNIIAGVRNKNEFLAALKSPAEYIFVLNFQNILNVEVEKEVYDEAEKYIWDGADLVLDPDYENKLAQKEREKIAMLSLTRGDVFRGLLMAKQVTRAEIRAMIENNETLSILEREMALIDFDEALNFYRGNPLIDTLGATLGITSEQLDQFFMTNDYTVLLVETKAEDEIS